MKVGIVTTFWGRVALSRIWVDGAVRARARFARHGVDCQVYAAGSEQPHMTMCATAGFKWAQKRNKHVGEKWNAAARLALADGCDFLLILGSDDFLSDSLVDMYCHLVRHTSTVYAGLTSIYMAEPRTGRQMLLEGTRKVLPENLPGKSQVYVSSRSILRQQKKAQRRAGLTTLGAGRLLHRALFEGHEYFWEPSRNRGLDASMAQILELPHPLIIHTTPEIFALDVKTPENIWSFDSLLEWYPHGELPEPGPIAALPEWPEIVRVFGNS